MTSLEYPDLPIQAFRKALGKNRPQTLEGIGGGKGGGGSAPSSPDPYTIAAATTQANKDIGAYNKALNLNNYTNPFGGQSTSISGYDPQTGAPIYQTNISGNPTLQGMLSNLAQQAGNSGSWLDLGQNAYDRVGAGYMGINNQLGSLNNQLSGLSAQDAMQKGQDAYYKQAASYLDPQYAQQQESLEAKLAAQGLAPGSQAYNNAFGNFQRDKDFAYNQAANSAITQGQQLGLNQLQAQQGLIGQQAGLLGQQGSNLGMQGSIVGQQIATSQIPYSNLQSIAQLIPGYSGPATSSINPADIGGYINNQYQSQLGQYNAGQQSRNQFTSGLMGLGGTLGAAYLMSDSRTKRDIKHIGDWNGTPVYSYRYSFEQKRRIGVLAQEAPSHAVKNACGLLMVDYRSL